MLVLTRRKDQKVLFPNLGISVEVVDVSGKAVRLGIDAPRDVRIVRSELECFDHPPIDASVTGVPKSGGLEDAEPFHRQIDAANLAIHLARNQMRQGRNAMAEDALDQALACLQFVDRSLAKQSSASPSEQVSKLSVHESRSGYQVSGTNSPDCTSSSDVLVFGGEPQQRQRINDCLGHSGFARVNSCGESDLVDWVLQNHQPDFALMVCPAFEPTEDSAKRPSGEYGLDEFSPGDAIANIGGLQQTGFIAVAGLRALQWRKPGIAIDLTT